MLRKYIQEKKEKWEDYLDTCLFVYNTSTQDLDAGAYQGTCNEAGVAISSQVNEIQHKESQHKALLDEVQKALFLLRKTEGAV